MSNAREFPLRNRQMDETPMDAYYEIYDNRQKNSHDQSENLMILRVHYDRSTVSRAWSIQNSSSNKFSQENLTDG